MFLAALALYASQGFGWGAFALFILAPDLAAAVYLLDKGAGSVAYNLAHFEGFPVALGLAGVLTASPVLFQAGLIWIAHIAIDRVLGYGLKYFGRFKDTHMQRV